MNELSNSNLKINFAKFLIVCELTYINALSLLYLVNELGLVHQIFAVVGSLAFSIITTSVMTEDTHKWVKVTLPIFDTLLVFCGLNLKYYNSIMDGTDNEIRFYLTMFIALFSGFSVYCLGLIKPKKKSNVAELESNIESLQRENKFLISDHETLQGDILKITTEHKLLTSRYEDLTRGYESLQNTYESVAHDSISLNRSKTDLHSQIEELESENNSLQTDIRFYESHYLRNESSRIKKKNAENLTDDEKKILERAALLTQQN